eukprot:7389003-Prymnesium_polylepis.1
MCPKTAADNMIAGREVATWVLPRGKLLLNTTNFEFFEHRSHKRRGAKRTVGPTSTVVPP